MYKSLSHLDITSSRFCLTHSVLKCACVIVVVIFISGCVWITQRCNRSFTRCSSCGLFCIARVLSCHRGWEKHSYDLSYNCWSGIESHCFCKTRPIWNQSLSIGMLDWNQNCNFSDFHSTRKILSSILRFKWISHLSTRNWILNWEKDLRQITNANVACRATAGATFPYLQSIITTSYWSKYKYKYKNTQIRKYANTPPPIRISNPLFPLNPNINTQIPLCHPVLIRQYLWWKYSEA